MGLRTQNSALSTFSGGNPVNRSLWWKIVLILAVLVGFSAAVVPTKSNPEPIRRGLDLKGGTHLVMRVNVGDATRLEVDQAMESLKNQAKKNNLATPTTRRVDDRTFAAMLPAGVSSTDYERIAKDYLPSFDLGRTPEGTLHFRFKSLSAA